MTRGPRLLFLKLAELRENFLVIANVPPLLVLGVNQLAIRPHVEHSSVAGNELRFDAQLFLD